MSKRKRSKNESSSSSSQHSSVKLNVGGVLMLTTRATLLAFPQSLLGRKFDEELKYGKPLTDEQGNIILDTDPDAFKIILHYLRRGKLVDGLSTSLRSMVCADADYFGLTDLVSECNQVSRNQDIKKELKDSYRDKNEQILESISVSLHDMLNTCIDETGLTNMAGKLEAVNQTMEKQVTATRLQAIAAMVNA